MWLPPLRMPEEALQIPDQSRLLTLVRRLPMVWNLLISLAAVTNSYAGQHLRKIAKPASPFRSYRQKLKILDIDLHWDQWARCEVWQADKKARGWRRRNGLARSHLALTKLGELSRYATWVIERCTAEFEALFRPIPMPSRARCQCWPKSLLAVRDTHFPRLGQHPRRLPRPIR